MDRMEARFQILIILLILSKKNGSDRLGKGLYSAGPIIISANLAR
jgi:hypothetical protein